MYKQLNSCYSIVKSNRNEIIVKVHQLTYKRLNELLDIIIYRLNNNIWADSSEYILVTYFLNFYLKIIIKNNNGEYIYIEDILTPQKYCINEINNTKIKKPNDIKIIYLYYNSRDHYDWVKPKLIENKINHKNIIKIKNNYKTTNNSKYYKKTICELLSKNNYLKKS